MSHEIHKQAREMLELQCKAYSDEVARLQSLIAALREKLDHIPDAGKMVGQEPVMWAYRREDGTYCDASGTHHSKGMHPLYPALPQRQPLTDEECVEAIDASFEFGLASGNVSNASVIRYARIIEAKLREKNS